MSVQTAEVKNETEDGSIFDVDEMSSSEDMEGTYDRLVDELTTEVMEGRSSDSFEELMDALAVASTYSTRNKYLIQAQNSDVVGPFNGYNQWVNEFGRVPEEGSNALWVLAPVILQYCEETEERAKYCSECEGNCDDTYGVMVDCKSVTTFAYSQTVELPEDEKPEDTKDIEVISEKDAHTENDPETVKVWYNNLIESYESAGFEVEEVTETDDWDLSTGARGFFQHDNRNVTVRNFRVGDSSKSVDITERFSTLVHEVAHSLLRHDENNISDSKKEMEAEAVAYIVCNRLGIETDAGVYISNHLESEADLTDYDEVRSLVEDSIERIGDISGEILEYIR